MKNITRTCIKTTVKASTVEMIEGNLKEKELTPCVLYGTSKPSTREINAEIRKGNPEVNNIFIKDVTMEEEVRSISFDDFYLHSKPIERPKSQQKNK